MPGILHASAQDDSLWPTLTCGETAVLQLQLAACRSPKGLMIAPDAEAICRRLLARMGLAHVWDLQVGGVLPGGLTLRGCSGGERKRLAIAAALLSCTSTSEHTATELHPSCPISNSICSSSSAMEDSRCSHRCHSSSGRHSSSGCDSSGRCGMRRGREGCHLNVGAILVDEPTSGLDSVCALSVIMQLRALAGQQPGNSGMAADGTSTFGVPVVAAIHQPRPAIWSKFDTVGWHLIQQCAGWGGLHDVMMLSIPCRVCELCIHQPCCVLHAGTGCCACSIKGGRGLLSFICLHMRRSPCVNSSHLGLSPVATHLKSRSMTSTCTAPACRSHCCRPAVCCSLGLVPSSWAG